MTKPHNPLSIVALTCADSPDRFGTGYIGTESDAISIELQNTACKFVLSIDSTCARQLAAALLAQADVFDAMNSKGA